jgi:class 3 adenylate cyclase/predicted ATPase
MRFVFADCVLDTQRYTLQRAGQSLILRPKVFQVLHYLLEHRQRVVSRQELCEQVWPDQFISEATLDSHLRSVRQAVGDSGQTQRVIQTLRGHGYRFVVSVTEVAPMAADEPIPRSATPPPVESPEVPAASAAEAPPVTPLRPLALAPLPAHASAISTTERRQLTILVCHLDEATALATHLELEDCHAVLQAYQSTCRTVVQRFDGWMAQALGDTLLVYFGWPQAHEDDAQRAVRTGLGMLEAIDVLHARLEREYHIRLAVRIGVHTGLVVIGEIGTEGPMERLALGVTPNIAARLQELAAPHTVVISATTARLVDGYFHCQAQGEQAFQGMAQPLAVYRVLQAQDVSNRLDLVPPRGLTPFVGREAEVQLLLERWEDSRQGHGHVVLLGGEAGIGKSRLVQVVRQHLASEEAQYITLRCSPYAQSSMLYPVIEHLQRVLDLHRGTSSEGQLDTLERVLRSYGLSLEQGVPLLAALLALPLQGRYAPLPLTPQQQRQRTLEVVIAWFLEETVRQPVLLVWEDLHWADPTSLELLALLLNQVPTARVLALVTCRPEFQPPWRLRSHVTQLTLERLRRPQMELIMTRLTGDKPLPAEVVQQIVDKTDGNPLFVEEMVKMVLESGLLQEESQRYVLAAPLAALSIPPTLRDSLTARLDHLSTGRRVASYAAVLGRQFSYELLQAAWPDPESVLHEGLTQLLDAELLYQRGVLPQASYVFKHALVQEAAYQSLVRQARQQYHQRIAQVLEVQFPAIAETQPELLAHHYTQGGCSEQAIAFWQQAGQRAVERSANLEAISHLTRGLEVLETLPDTAARAQHELDIQTALGAAFIATKGHASPVVERVYSRARALCQQVGQTPQLYPVLWGMWRFYLVRGAFDTTYELSEQLLRLAQGTQDPAVSLGAHVVRGVTLFCRGEVAAARAHLEQGTAFSQLQPHAFLPSLYGLAPGVVCFAWLALSLWVLGYPDQARHRIAEALALAQEPGQPYNLTFASLFAAFLSQLCRDVTLAHERAEATVALCVQQGFARYWEMGKVVRGWAVATGGHVAAGLQEIRQGLEAQQAAGAENLRPYSLALLAEAHGQGGQAEVGLSVLSAALVMVDTNGERFYEAELYRLKGELLLALFPEDPTDAETCFHRAIDIARQQQAKSWELRAATSLSRLWDAQGKGHEAHQLLAGIYAWFTEGFATQDLQQAKALLATLA